MKKQDTIPQQNVITTKPFPKSKKIFVQGQLHNIQVAMRAVTLSPTMQNGKVLHENPPVTIYDTSGPYTDENATIDVHQGLTKLRASWIQDRNDTEQLTQFSSNYCNERLENNNLNNIRFKHIQKPLKDLISL